MTYIQYIDTFVSVTFKCNEIFYILQIFLAWTVFYLSVWQRVFQTSFKNIGLEHGVNWWTIKSGQLGLYIYMMVSVISIIDGFQGLFAKFNDPHLFIIFILIATVLSKINIIIDIKKQNTFLTKDNSSL